MRRADRLFDVIQVLRTAKQPVTAATLAAELEVTVRTIYRDVATLQARRVPIEGAPGLGYVLRKGFDLPPLMFTVDEVEAVTVGARMVQRLRDPELQAAARRVLDKVTVVLPESLRGHVAEAPFYVSRGDAATPRGIDMAGVRGAIRDRRKLRIAYVDETVAEGETVKVGSLQGRVLDTPGHTAGHISFVFPADKLAFVGDTLFSIGCGRVIEGDPQMMWNSLLKLRGLPDDTHFYCGHEYTEANIRFAKSIEPNNKALAARAEEVAKLRAAGKPTIPATIGAEKAANPFLRADNSELAISLGLGGQPAWKVFAEIRERKNRF